MSNQSWPEWEGQLVRMQKKGTGHLMTREPLFLDSYKGSCRRSVGKQKCEIKGVPIGTFNVDLVLSPDTSTTPDNNPGLPWGGVRQRIKEDHLLSSPPFPPSLWFGWDMVSLPL